MNAQTITLDLSTIATSALGLEIKEAHATGAFDLPTKTWNKLVVLPKATVRQYRDYAREIDMVEGQNPTAQWDWKVIAAINGLLDDVFGLYDIVNIAPEGEEVARYRCSFSAPSWSGAPGYYGILETIVRLHKDGRLEERTFPYQMQWKPLFEGSRLAEELLEFRTK